MFDHQHYWYIEWEIREPVDLRSFTRLKSVTNRGHLQVILYLYIDAEIRVRLVIFYFPSEGLNSSREKSFLLSWSTWESGNWCSMKKESQTFNYRNGPNKEEVRSRQVADPIEKEDSGMRMKNCEREAKSTSQCTGAWREEESSWEARRFIPYRLGQPPRVSI